MANHQQPRKGISYQACGRIILEYDREQQVQSVFWIESEERELKSSFVCLPGKRAVHAFSVSLKYKDDKYHKTVVEIRFAAEPLSNRVLYWIRYRREDADEPTWWLWQSNIEPKQLFEFPVVGLPDELEIADEEQCKQCGSELVCTNCNPPTCEACGSIMTECADCEAKENLPDSLKAFDAVRMQEELSEIDPERLQSALGEHVGDFADHAAPWPDFLKQLLDDLGEDTSSVSLNLTKNAEPDDDTEADEALG